MSNFSIQASYTKKEQSSEVSPTISNTVTVSNTITPTETTTELIEPQTIVRSKILPPKHVLEAKKTIEMDAPQDKPTFERKLLSICLHVLSSQDKTLINNIIDVTGDIILAQDDLIELIKIATGESKVKFIIDDRTLPGCLRKIPIWKPISKIIVNDSDFEICYNKTYVMFAEYKVSLKKVVV